MIMNSGKAVEAETDVISDLLTMLFRRRNFREKD